MSNRFMVSWMMLLNAAYIFRRLLHLEKPSKLRVALIFAATFVLGLFTYFMNHTLHLTVSIWQTAGLVALMYYLYRRDLNNTFLTVVFSLGFVYALYIPAILVVNTIQYFLDMHETWHYYLLTFMVGAVMFLFAWLIFRLPRLRNGIPYLMNNQADIFGYYIALSLLFILTIQQLDTGDVIIVISLLLMVLLGVMIIIWMHMRTKREYVSRIREREIERLSAEFERQNAEIDRLSSLIHRDNKLLSAMTLAVDEVLANAGHAAAGEVPANAGSPAAGEVPANAGSPAAGEVTVNAGHPAAGVILADADHPAAGEDPANAGCLVVGGTSAKAGQPSADGASSDVDSPADGGDATNVAARALILQKQLRELSEERLGIIRSYELENQPLSPSGLPAVDMQLSYMQKRAAAEGIHLDFSEDGTLSRFVPKVYTETEMVTLLADLLENAIHATAAAGGDRIFLFIGLRDGAFGIEVSDTGIPFPESVLAAYGKGRFTTRADEGGIGIGLETIHDILKKHGGSFQVVPLPEDAPYRKTIRIRLA